MTNRTEPTENVENGETLEQSDAEVVADLVGADGDDIATAVRHWETDRRSAAVLAAMSDGTAIPTETFASIMAVDYIDPTVRNVVADTVNSELERLARMMLAADDTADVAAEFAAALSRVTPDDVTDDDRTAVTDAVTPRRRGGTRRAPSYDVTGLSGTYRFGPAPTTGSTGGTVTLTVSDGVGTYTCEDGEQFDSPTGALRHGQGWDAAGVAGNGSGWPKLIRVGGRHDGETLANLARV